MSSGWRAPTAQVADGVIVDPVGPVADGSDRPYRVSRATGHTTSRSPGWAAPETTCVDPPAPPLGAITSIAVRPCRWLPLRTSSQPNWQCGGTPLLRAVLEDAAVFREDLQASQVLFDAHGQRFLHVGVLFGPGRGDGDRHVPVVGRGDHHGVDVVAGQQFAEIGVGTCP